MFSQGTATIDRTVEEVYEFISDLKSQLSCWEMLYIPSLNELLDGITQVEGSYQLGRKNHRCEVELYHTRPGSGAVTHVRWDSGELAAEWRIMESGDRTKIELNIEGQGGGLAASVNLRQMPQRILNRLKQHFDMA